MNHIVRFVVPLSTVKEGIWSVSLFYDMLPIATSVRSPYSVSHLYLKQPYLQRF